MLPTEALEQIVVVCSTIDEIRHCRYPAPSTISSYPYLVVLMGEGNLAFQSTEQYWSFTARGLLLTGLVNDLKKHVSSIDPLIAKVVDKFSSGNFNGFTLRRENGDIVDGCQVTSFAGSQVIDYAGHQHYGAVINLSIELRRFTE